MENEWDALPAISVRQPWSYLICSGLKPIENRTWKLPEKYKGQRVLIHAGAKPAKMINPNNIFSYKQWEAMGEQGRVESIVLSSPLSAIIGSVEIADCVINHPSIWAEHSIGYSQSYPNGVPVSCANKKYKPIYNWVLKNPVLFDEPILNVKGHLGFFTPKID
jgi:hypothetical protein